MENDPRFPVAWRAVGGSIWRHKTSEDDEPLYGAELKRVYDLLIKEMCKDIEERNRLLLELEAQRIYARELCKAIEAATKFAGIIAGGASWWDDVWTDHEAAIDRARERISAAGGPAA